MMARKRTIAGFVAVGRSLCAAAAMLALLAPLSPAVWSQEASTQNIETRVYELRNVDAPSAQISLVEALGPSAALARVVADPTTNRLIVVAPTPLHNRVASLLPELDMELATTRRVLEAVPAAKTAYRPHEKSWTLGELSLHVANVLTWLPTTLLSSELYAPE